ncbi:MAG: hypothetical protein DMF56_09725 [Acidobacteria bacterium]|nr:MAG: hypothetical protein DMF56_09725 [Acidobacteriota bacterium]
MTKKALVVGIDKYEPPTRPLKAAVAEANNWADLLRTKYGFTDIRMRPDSSATKAVILDDLENWLLSGAMTGDQLVFVFCGHGTVVPIGGRMADEALLMFHSPNGNRIAAALTDSEVSAVVKRVKPPPDALITIILECCFAGGFDPDTVAADFDVGPPDADIDAQPLFEALIDDTELSTILTIHRFSSLWDKGIEVATVDLLVVAACEEGRFAQQLPVVSGFPPHLLFSSRAIPALRQNFKRTYLLLLKAINPLASDQRATLLGNVPRRPHPFLT